MIVPKAVLVRPGVMAKVISSFVTLFLCAAGIGLLALNKLGDVEENAREIGGHWLQTTRALGDISYLAQRLRVIEAALLLAPPQEKTTEEKTIFAIRKDIDDALGRQAKLARSRDEEAELVAIKRTWEAYLGLDDRFEEAAKSPGDAAALLYRTQMRDSIHDFQDAVKQAIKRNIAMADAAIQENAHLDAVAYRDLLAGIGVVFAICLFVVWRLHRSVLGPIRQLTGVMTQLAASAANVEIPALDRSDEIGAMARASAFFRDAARERRVELEREAEAQRAAAASERDLASAQRERVAQAQSAAMHALGDGLRALAEGDLQHHLPADFPKEFEALSANFEDAREKLGETLRALVASTATLAQECQALGTGADELSERTERQAASLEQSSAALGEITGAIKASSSGAAEAKNAAAAATGQARRGFEVVGEAVEAMDGLSRSASEIREITGLIDEIAFQTNLLALNAGVEAARAGDAGRGFAVVATEVRALASRSADMAKRISDLISNSDRQVAVGVAKVAATGQALQRIAGEIGSVNSVVEGIAARAVEQAHQLDEVNAAVREMDQVTQRNAIMVQQTTGATQRVREEIVALETLVRQFRLEKKLARRLG